MVRFTLKRSLRRFLLQGGGDERRHRIAALLAGLDRLDDVTGARRAASTIASRRRPGRGSPACSSFFRIRRATETGGFLAARSASMVQYSRLSKARISRSRSTISAQRHGLHAPGGEPAAHLVPEQRRDLVAHQAVQHAARLLRVHQVCVHLRRASRTPRRMAFLVISLNITR